MTDAFRHLYVHVPFCARRCSYCDFAIAVRSRVPVDAFVQGIRRELDIRFPGDEPLGALDTLYLGGGTPSRLGGDGVARLLEALLARFTLSSGAEVTIEANPEDVSAAGGRSWAAAGVNRVSLGVQSFDARVLAWMHRTHDPDAVLTAADALNDAALHDWSLDLIYALPESLGRDWEGDVRQAIALQPPHLSAYGLTVEPGTPLGRWRERGSVSEADETRYAAEFLRTHAMLAREGYEHYEVSNYARAGNRARHNSAYWSGASYLGLGPSAHGYDGTTRRWNEREYAGWLARVTAGADPLAGSEALGPEQRAIESDYLALRTDRGLPVSATDAEFVRPWLEAGWGTIRESTFRLTPDGWLRLDALVGALTVHRSRY